MAAKGNFFRFKSVFVQGLAGSRRFSAIQMVGELYTRVRLGLWSPSEGSDVANWWVGERRIGNSRERHEFHELTRIFKAETAGSVGMFNVFSEFAVIRV